MNAPRRPPQTWLWPLLAFGIAGSGTACSAPAPPTQPNPSNATPARETADDPSPAATPAASPPATDAPEALPPEPDDAAAAEEPDRTTPAARPAQQTQRPAQPPTASRPPSTQTTDEEQAATPTTLTVTMLSRGKGVPDEARSAYQDAHALLEQLRDAGIVATVHTQRIGLEGETRLCAEFRSERDARDALAEIRKRSAGVDLLDARLAPCPSPKGKSP